MNWFDIFILIISLYSIIKGYKTGLIKQLTALIGLIIGAILAGKVSDVIYPYVKQAVQIPESITASASYIIAFGLIILLFYFIGKMLESIVKAIKIGPLNKLLGSIFCLTKWCFVISIVLNIIVKLDSKKLLISDATIAKSYTFTHIQKIAPLIVPYLKFKL